MVIKTSFDILDVLFPVVNVDGVNDVIDGAVYADKKPLDSKLQDILLQVQSNANPDGLVQQAVVNINCFCRNLESDGLVDRENLKTITNAVITALNNYTETTEYFNFDLIWQVILPDSDDKVMSYSNIRINCNVGNNT